MEEEQPWSQSCRNALSSGIGGAFRTFVDSPRPLDYKEPESAAKGPA
jgi:hypothetical protein